MSSVVFEDTRDLSVSEVDIGDEAAIFVSLGIWSVLDHDDRFDGIRTDSDSSIRELAHPISSRRPEVAVVSVTPGFEVHTGSYV